VSTIVLSNKSKYSALASMLVLEKYNRYDDEGAVNFDGKEQ
jgi:hypothetical protein